jgi:hypothetical protein
MYTYNKNRRKLFSQNPSLGSKVTWPVPERFPFPFFSSPDPELPSEQDEIQWRFGTKASEGTGLETTILVLLSYDFLQKLVNAFNVKIQDAHQNV